MLLEKYLQQQAVFQKLKCVNAYGEALYEPPVVISVRNEMYRKLVRNEKGDTVVSNTTVFCLEEVRPQDMLDGQCVIAVTDMRNKLGELVGTEVFL